MSSDDAFAPIYDAWSADEESREFVWVARKPV